jgi:hypothetical protein
MHTEQAKDFSDDCDSLLVALEQFRDEATVARSTLHLPSGQSARKSGMPSTTQSQSHSQSQVLVTVKRRPGDCPRSIKRLCKNAGEATPDARAGTSARLVSRLQRPPRPIYVPDKPLLIRRWDEEQVYEVTIITTESLLAPDWSEPGDAVFSWSSIFRLASPFCLVSTNRTLKNWGFSLRSRSPDEIRSSIDGWLAAELARKIKPWNEERANAIRSLVELRYQWTDLFVRLRPVTSTTDDPSMHAFAELLQRHSYRLVRQNPSKPEGPASRSRNDPNAR